MTENITKPQPASSQFIKGLEGVVAAQTTVSMVDGANSYLCYVGIPIEELVQYSTFEEVTYLLWYRKLPNQSELEEFKQRLVSKRKLSSKIAPILNKFPKTGHPMSVLRTVVSMSGVFDVRADIVTPEESQRKAYRLTAMMPAIIAAWYRICEGEEPIDPNPELSHAANFLYMMQGKVPSPEMEKALDAYLILLADHGLNASTFAARVTTGTNSNVYSAVTSAIGTLMGDLHGCANQRAMEMLMEIGKPEKAREYIFGLLDQKKKVMGFGHRIYKGKDPRAEAFREIAAALCRKSEDKIWMEVAAEVEKAMATRNTIASNVDFFSAPVLYILGFPIKFFTTVFAASRIAGWCAHIIEQQRDNRLIRPQSEYTGPRDQPYIPIEKRG